MHNSAKTKTITHPFWLRLTHWLNAVAVIIMVLSGWRIYDANPFLGFSIPPELTLGGWLGGGIQWHFAAMWLLIGNGLLYLQMNILTGRLFQRFFPLGPVSLVRDMWNALRGKLGHADLAHFNAVQKAAYLFVIVAIALLVMSGLVMWKSVQFPELRELLGGYEFARRIHFFAMAGIVAFLIVHVVMVALVPRSLLAMLRGRG